MKMHSTMCVSWYRDFCHRSKEAVHNVAVALCVNLSTMIQATNFGTHCYFQRMGKLLIDRYCCIICTLASGLKSMS